MSPTHENPSRSTRRTRALRLGGALLCAALALPPRAPACDAMMSADYREPPEWIELGLDRGVWDIASRARTSLFARKEFVRTDETLDGWSELVTWNANFGENAFDLVEAQAGLLRGLQTQCGENLHSRELRTEKGDRIFEWWHEGCQGRPAQHELVRMWVGKLATHLISYGRRGSALPEAERERWFSWIQGVQRRERIPLAGELSPFDQAQVAVWKGEYERAVKLLEPLLAAGDPQAQELFGRLHTEGWGVERDYAKAREWFERAAERSAAAAYDLGVLYENGWGVPADPATAYRWYRKAAERGEMDAEGRVGFMRAEGTGTERDGADAFRWFERAAAQGHEHARYWLGRLSEQGATGAPDLDAAQRWYDEAARAGELEAQYALGVLCADAARPDCGEPQARKWLMRATMQGHDAARELYLKRFSRPEPAPAGEAAGD